MLFCIFTSVILPSLIDQQTITKELSYCQDFVKTSFNIVAFYFKLKPR